LEEKILGKTEEAIERSNRMIMKEMEAKTKFLNNLIQKLSSTQSEGVLGGKHKFDIGKLEAANKFEDELKRDLEVALENDGNFICNPIDASVSQEHLISQDLKFKPIDTYDIIPNLPIQSPKLHTQTSTQQEQLFQYLVPSGLQVNSRAFQQVQDM
jgi:hypothetical protein